jgi:outer membrane murein-binding lipoprotein Lpp
MKGIIIAAAIAGGVLLGGCSGTSPHHIASSRVAAATTAPTLTASQGAAICNDLKAWLPSAFKQNMPRFNAQLQSDESEAARTPLGTDLSDLDSNLQQLNSVAFFSSPPGYTGGPPTGTGPLHQDCAAYGVNIKLPSS